ncbi:hypothetical protein LCGC14_2392260 [marine sediment metagenome]|uniref:Phage Gp37Gp68 family protein n=1 Tax=marine sediment metagenome TaxID=412755 RepID=A0A0F9BXW1_9ZZZZ
MSTKISWADKSWNPIVGCSKISAGCANCYAERQAIRLRGMGQEQYSNVVWPKHFEGAENKKGWNGKTIFVESALTKPLHWRKPRKIFVCSMSDLFHESVPFEWIDRVFAVMALCPQHEFKVLTKRAGRQLEYMTEPKADARDCYNGIVKPEVQFRVHKRALGMVHERQQTDKPNYNMWNGIWPLLNVHLGVTVENQDNVGRIAELIRTPAAKRFVSLEPLLGEIAVNPELLLEITYAFIGAESKVPAKGKPGHRPLCTLENIDELIGQCQDVGVSVHVKQIPLNGKCNKNFDEWPPEFQVREV